MLKSSLVPPVKGGCQLADRGVAFREGQLAAGGALQEDQLTVEGGAFKACCLLIFSCEFIYEGLDQIHRDREERCSISIAGDFSDCLQVS